MKCLDTTFLIDFLRNEKDAVDKASQINDDALVTTTINVFEVLFGIYKRKEKPEKELEAFKSLLSKLDILEFDISSSFQASRIAADLVKQGKQINMMDTLIAGIILSKNCNNIVTRDKEDFGKIKELNVEGY